MKYQANPVIVDASRILSVLPALPSGHVGMVLENDGWHLATPDQLARITPASGDYVVMQEDGYIYLNPKDVFERKYSPVICVNFNLSDNRIVIDRDGKIHPPEVESFVREIASVRGT